MTDESYRPAVSVIIPTYNRADHLPRAVASVFEQTFDDFELIVLDDGSTDGTIDLLRAWEAEHAHRFRWSAHPNMGQIRTVNKGFEIARGDFLYILNSDDYLYPNCLENLVGALRANPDAVLAYGDWDVVDLDDEIIIEVTNDSKTTVEVIRDAIPTGAGVLYTRSIVDEVGGWDPEFPIMPDYAFWLAASLHGEFVHTPHRVAVWRSHEGTITVASRGRPNVDSFLRLFDAYFADPRVPDKIREIEPQAWRSMFILCGLHMTTGTTAPESRFHTLDTYARRSQVVEGQQTIEEELLAWRAHARRLEDLDAVRLAEIEAERAHAGRLEMITADANRKREASERRIEMLTAELDLVRRSTPTIGRTTTSSNPRWKRLLHRAHRTIRRRP